MKKILFLCTGNYYRSRFAEEYFNHLAEKAGLNWQASSKGLSQNMPSLNNPGPISVHTLDALKTRNIEGRDVDRYPRPIEKADFNRYDRIIALSEDEHRPMLEARFLAHYGKVGYFEVGDLPLEEPKLAMQKIASHIDDLVEKLSINAGIELLCI
jgi:protein-tyrosine phosphatase